MRVERRCGISAMNCVARAAAHTSRGCRLRATCTRRVPMTTASADRAHGARRRARRGCRSRRRPARARVRLMRGTHRGHRAGVEVAGAGHALQRHVVDVAAGDAADLLMRASVEVGASRKIGSMPARLQRRGEALAFLGRIVDDQHAVDTGLPARRRRSAPTPVALDRVRVAHQHDRRGVVAPAEVAHVSRAPAACRCRAPARARRPAGSPGRRPSGRRTARRARSRRRRPSAIASMISTVASAYGSPAVT